MKRNDLANMAYCPYCVSLGIKDIVCEGMAINDVSCQRFSSPRKREMWYERVCRSERYARLCPMAAALNALLDEEAPEVAAAVRLVDPAAREAVLRERHRRGRTKHLRRLRRDGTGRRRRA